MSSDNVNSPKHYQATFFHEGKEQSLECINAIEASMSTDQYQGYLKGSALKYLWRYDKKHASLDGKEECLKKAIWFLDTLRNSLKNHT